MPQESGGGNLGEELEMRIAYQDRTIEKLDELLTDHARRIEGLERDLRDLGRRIGIATGEDDGSPG